jgi:hypothetical protein
VDCQSYCLYKRSSAGVFLGLILIAAFPVTVTGFTEDITKRIGIKVRLIGGFISGALLLYLFTITSIRIGVWGLDALFLNIWVAVIFLCVACALDISLQIGAGQINRIYKKIARKAGLDESEIEGISGHSMRVGAAQDLLNSGASMPIIMQRGRWSKTDTVMRYVEHSNCWAEKSPINYSNSRPSSQFEPYEPQFLPEPKA